jgi:subtilisin family serine protease
LIRRSLLLFLSAAGALAAAPPHVPGRLLAGRGAALDDAVETRTWRLHGAVERRHLASLGVHVLDVPEANLEAVRQSLQQTGLFDYVEPDYYAEQGGATPNDSYYGSQWYLPKIASADAWTRTTGSAAVVIAVVDSGVYAAHPDLAGKLVPGWSFLKNNADTSDTTGHGTEVSGAMAAATNNGIGVAGVSWSSVVMPLAVVEATSFAAYSDIAAAIQYAVDHKVRVINVSIGGTAASTTLQNAVDYAWNRGAMVFAAAMNSGVATPNYPGACNHAIAVSATDEGDGLAAFSNYGSWLTLSAPGTDILTTMNGGGYGYVNGTSFASPIAAGVAALVLAANPQLTSQQVVDILKQSADHPGAAGFDPYYGWGRVNAGRAVQLAIPAVTLPAPSPAPAPVATPAHRTADTPGAGHPRRR